MNTLLNKLRKSTTVAETDVLSESKFFADKDMISTPVPALNIALSGRIDGGLTPGLTTFAGPSKHFKTAFTMILAQSYLKKYEDAVLLFYDSEFGSPQSYFESFDIPLDRVLHTPITDIEMLKHDIMVQLEQVKRGDKLIIVVDSIGNLASKKEVDDALEGKSVADMTRAKQLKSLFRMVTPHLAIKDIPMVVINHSYKTLEVYSKDVVAGGNGNLYSSDSVFIIGRRQQKEDDEVTGYDFVINVEKSRFVKEKTQIPISVSFEGGISSWSGLLDMALEAGLVTNAKKGWYALVDPETGEVHEKSYRKKQLDNKEFWLPILKSPKFQEWVEKTYRLSQIKMINDDQIDQEYESIDSEIDDE